MNNEFITILYNYFIFWTSSNNQNVKTKFSEIRQYYCQIHQFNWNLSTNSSILMIF